MCGTSLRPCAPLKRLERSHPPKRQIEVSTDVPTYRKKERKKVESSGVRITRALKDKSQHICLAWEYYLNVLRVSIKTVIPNTEPPVETFVWSGRKCCTGVTSHPLSPAVQFSVPFL